MRMTLCLTLLAFTGSPLLAQQSEDLPMSAVLPAEELTKVSKARYIAGQLSLTAEQQEQVEKVIDTLWPDGGEGPPDINLEEVKQLWQKMEEAKAAGDMETFELHQERLREIGRGVDYMPEFLKNLESIANDAQKARLEMVVGRLERNPTGGIRPIDLLKTARSLVDESYDAKIEDLKRRFRSEINTGRVTDERRLELLNGLLADVRQMLPDEQRTKFNAQVEAMRPDKA